MENTEKPKYVKIKWLGSDGKTQVKCQFMDSFMHMSQKLETLIQNQRNFKLTSNYIKKYGDA